MFEGDRSIDMINVCPKDVKKMFLQQARIFLENVGIVVFFLFEKW